MHLLLLLAAPGLALATPRQASNTTLTLTVDAATRYQTIDGFGFSEAFQRANNILNLPEPRRSALVDLLFNATAGAGFTIVRNGIGSSPNSSQDWMNTIEPESPGSPGAAPAYAWDGRDSGQLWLSQQAAKYGVRTFYADAWSAPGFMKSNGQDAGGGTLCGSPGTPACATGDWRQAYADYLVQLVQLYRREGVNITHLGFLNEPDYTTAYASMRMDGAQAADFIKVLHPTLARNNLSAEVAIACCDSTGWATQRAMTTAIVATPGVEDLVGVFTSHLYTSAINASTPLQPTRRKVWETETADLGGKWSTAWDSTAANASSRTGGDGLVWAGKIHTGLTAGNLSAYLWWVATQDAATNGNNNEKLVLVDDAAGDYVVAKRLWAFAQYSRAVRPGAVRVGVSPSPGSGFGKNSTTSSLLTTAFVNADSSVAVVAVNNATAAVPIAISLAGVGAKSKARAWVTDSGHDMDAVPAAVGPGGLVTGVSVPARGMVSVVVS